jgi:hypothetical protein
MRESRLTIPVEILSILLDFPSFCLSMTTGG